MSVHDGLAKFWQSAFCSISQWWFLCGCRYPSCSLHCGCTLHTDVIVSILFIWRFCEPMLGRLNPGRIYISSELHESFLHWPVRSKVFDETFFVDLM